MSERNVRKTKIGKVISDKMDKTVVVAVEELEQHKLTRSRSRERSIPRTRREERRTCRRQGFHHGTRPLSKTKRWRVVEVVERAK